MQHSFDTEIAKEYGVFPAILLNNLYHWITKNKANNSNFFDGNYWTYNTKKAFATLFPYMSERQIDYALKKLIDSGIIITGNYNKNPCDRTLWYAITKVGYCILQNCEMQTTMVSNGNDNFVAPIPNINPNINTDITIIHNKPYTSGGGQMSPYCPPETDFIEKRQRIFAHWNGKNIIKHREFTPQIAKAINKALASYDEDTICMLIDRYAQVIADETFFFDYKWTLKDFLSRKDGISSFTDEGSKWASYQQHISKPKGKSQPRLQEQSFDIATAFELAIGRSYGD